MKMRRLILIAICCLGIQSHATKHSDNDMKQMILKYATTINNTNFDNPLQRLRCPHDSDSDELKYGLIKRGYEKGFYSLTIRDELTTKRLYPIIGYDMNRGEDAVLYVCQFGCFALSTQILTVNENGTFSHISAGRIDSNTKLAGLQSEFFFDKPVLISKKIESIIKSKEPEKEKLIAFELSNGNTLKVTVNHGMVLSDGRVIASQDVKQGDSFVGYNGKTVEITKISDFDQNNGVINFRLEGENTRSNHIMGAEGVLVGDHAWQSDMKDDLNGIAIRSASLKN